MLPKRLAATLVSFCVRQSVWLFDLVGLRQSGIVWFFHTEQCRADTQFGGFWLAFKIQMCTKT